MNETEPFSGLLTLAENVGIGFMMLSLVLIFVVIVGVISGLNGEDKK